MSHFDWLRAIDLLDPARASAGLTIFSTVATAPTPYTGRKPSYINQLTCCREGFSAGSKAFAAAYVRDIAPVASLVRFAGVLVVQPSFVAKTIPQLIAYAKTNPGAINMASGGVGSAQHLFGELFKAMARVDMVHVPYRGGGPALLDLLAGQVSLMFDTLPTSIDQIRAGKLRPLAVTAAERTELLPDTPAVNEFVLDYEAGGWVGIGAPRNTPAAIVNKLNTEINAALASPQVRARITDQTSIPFASSPAEFRKFIVEFTDKWAKVIRSADIKVG